MNGDGKLNVVLGTRAGDLYVLEAATGTPIENFPMQISDAGAPIRSPITLFDPMIPKNDDDIGDSEDDADEK